MHMQGGGGSGQMITVSRRAGSANYYGVQWILRSTQMQIGQKLVKNYWGDGAKLKMITLSHKGELGQLITILHRGGPLKVIT